MRPPRRLLRELAPPIHLAGVTYQQKWIRCGKYCCRGRFPKWHGPYWYAFYKTTENRIKAKYIGIELPPAIVEEFHDQTATEAHIMREARREVRKRKRRHSPMQP